MTSVPSAISGPLSTSSDDVCATGASSSPSSMTGASPQLSHDIADASEHKVVIKALTGVRALAALWVVVGHFSLHVTALFPAFSKMLWFAFSGFLGVDLFFVLSGFILTHNYFREFDITVRRESYFKFLWLRVARLYPVHIFTLFVLLGGLVAAHVAHMNLNMPGRMTVADFVRNLFMVQAWGFADDVSWNGPAWSISCEFFAYLLFPLVTMMVMRIRSTSAAWMGFIVMYVLLLSYFQRTGYTNTTTANDGALVRVITEFISGCLLYRIYQFGWGKRWNWSIITVLIVAAILAWQYVCPVDPVVSAQHAYIKIGMNLYVAPLLAVLILALARATGPIAAFLGSATMVFWGEASYALYMTHDVVRMVLGKMINIDHFAQRGVPIRVGVLAAYFGITLMVAVATYMLVERPARRWLRSLITRKPQKNANLTEEVTPECPRPAL